MYMYVYENMYSVYIMYMCKQMLHVYVPVPIHVQTTINMYVYMYIIIIHVIIDNYNKNMFTM